MYTGIKHLHSTLAYLFFVVLIIAVIYFLVAWIQRKPFTQISKRIALYGLIMAHLQLVVGLVLYFISPMGLANFGADAMGDSILRLYIVEHPLTNIIGIVLITIGYSLSKKAVKDSLKFKRLFIYYTIGLLLISLRIPWQVWPNW